MTTFSQLVDNIIAETLRPDLRAAFEQFVNLTVLELHNDKESAGVMLYGANRKEAIVNVTAEGTLIWDFPRPAVFQTLESVYYPGSGLMPRERSPGMAMAMTQEIDGHAYFYRTGNAYAFFGHQGIGSQIYLSWFERCPRLVWIKPTDRQVTWNELTQTWSWGSGVTPDQYEAILAKNTHWMLERWHDVINAGAKAKAYVRVGDETRARLAYSLYENLRTNLQTAESVSAVGRIVR